MSGPAAARGVAAFDFDGTITQRDTLAGFVAAACSPGRLVTSVATSLPAMVRGAFADDHRDRAKELVVGRALRGRHVDELTVLGERYAERLVGRCRFDTLAAIEWHRERHHRVVIVSASLVYYLRPMARHLGVDHVIGVEMALDDDGVATGRFVGPNVRGHEKVRRLNEHLTAESIGGEVEVWAYGNSAGDAAMLQRADHAVWVS